MQLRKQAYSGFVIMFVSAVTTCVAQFLWKLSGNHNSFWLLFAGLCLYGIGAVLMLLAFRNGEASALHPVLSVGYIGSLILGSLFLEEKITVQKVGGILLILFGLVLLVLGSMEAEKKK